MNVKIDPKLARASKKYAENTEELVNWLLEAYIKKDLFAKGDIALFLKVDRPFRVERNEIADMFDEITQEFRGTAVVGKSKSETLWIPSPALHDALKEYNTVLVLKTPRKKGIRTVEGEKIYAWIPEEDDVN